MTETHWLTIDGKKRPLWKAIAPKNHKVNQTDNDWRFSCYRRGATIPGPDDCKECGGIGAKKVELEVDQQTSPIGTEAVVLCPNHCLDGKSPHRLTQVELMQYEDLLNRIMYVEAQGVSDWLKGYDLYSPRADTWLCLGESEPDTTEARSG